MFGVVAVIFLLVGVLLGHLPLSASSLVFAAALIFLVRPLAVGLTTIGGTLAPHQRRLVAWFGIRGIGSLYYLAFALHHGVPASIAPVVADAALVAIAMSIALHGVSATPLMAWYERRRRA